MSLMRLSLIELSEELLIASVREEVRKKVGILVDFVLGEVGLGGMQPCFRAMYKYILERYGSFVRKSRLSSLASYIP